MRTRILCLLLLVALVAAACGNDPEPQATRLATPSESPPPPEPIRCPLTGVEAGAVDINRPAMAVKIDNHPRARPQTGLETADIVYEELVEGGLTRFMGVYHCGDAGDLGPVRSARAVDPDILVQYAPVLFAYSGASPNNLNKIAATAGVVNLVHGANGPAYSRRGGGAPHNLFTSTEKIRARPAAQGVQGPPRIGIVFNPDLGAAAESPSASPSPTGSATESPGSPAPAAPAPVAAPGNKVSFAYSAAAVVDYTYDPATRRYLRSQGGAPHNAASGTRLGGTNVVVMKVPVSRGGSSPEIAVTGIGEVVVLRNGEAIVGQWHRGTLGDQTTFVDAAGQPIEFAPGNTWINLLPDDQGWTLE